MGKPTSKKEKEGAQKKEKAVSTREKEFSEAVERVYRKYGTNLSAFQRDIQKDLVKRS